MSELKLVRLNVSYSFRAHMHFLAFISRLLVSQDDYRRQLAQVLSNQSGTSSRSPKILAFRKKPPAPSVSNSRPRERPDASKKTEGAIRVINNIRI